MEITNLTKSVDYNRNKVHLTVEIELNCADFEVFDYQGFDKIQDEMIPDILVAVGRRYSNKIKNGKIRSLDEVYKTR